MQKANEDHDEFLEGLRAQFKKEKDDLQKELEDMKRKDDLYE